MNIIFDLDGTLSDCEHRRHLVTKDRRDPQWWEFFQRCKDDTPIMPTIMLFRALAGHEVRIWSGREESTRQITLDWLNEHVICDASRFPLRMRPIGNTEPDDVLKEKWLLESFAAGWKPDLVFDDRNKVVAMWRRHGIMCAQVAPGNF